MSHRVSVAMGLVWATLASVATEPLDAQINFPALRHTGVVINAKGDSVTLSSTPSHADFAVRQYVEEQEARFSILDSLPKDSIRIGRVMFAAPYLKKYTSVEGLQHQPFSLVAYSADDDHLGYRHITDWLATPNLPLSDQASALIAQIEANIDPERSDRMALAARVLNKLESLGPRYMSYAAKLHWRMVDAYYEVGDREAMIAHGERGIAIVRSAKKWGERRDMIRMTPLLELAQAYSGALDGKARLETVLKQYRDAYDVTAEELPSLPKWQVDGWIRSEQKKAEQLMAQVRQIGSPGLDLQAHAWINAGIEDRQDAPVARKIANGKIQVVEFGYMHCPACLKSLPILERLSRRFEDKPVDVVYLTWTVGAWDLDLVSPEVEVTKLRDLYVNRFGLTFPIGIWAGEKVANNDGGETPAESVSNNAYKVVMTPEIVVLDGAGRIRFRSHGSDERVLNRVVKFLLRDSETQSQSATALPLGE